MVDAQTWKEFGHSISSKDPGRYSCSTTSLPLASLIPMVLKTPDPLPLVGSRIVTHFNNVPTRDVLLHVRRIQTRRYDTIETITVNENGLRIVIHGLCPLAISRNKEEELNRVSCMNQCPNIFILLEFRVFESFTITDFL